MIKNIINIINLKHHQQKHPISSIFFFYLDCQRNYTPLFDFLIDWIQPKQNFEN